MYKLIALDMDGTLLKNDKTISEATHTAIQRAKDKGVKVVLATGRPTKGIQKYLKELDLMNHGDYAVAFNGAVIQSTKTGEIIAQNLMNFNDLEYLYDLSIKLHVNIHFLTADACITPKYNPYSQVEVDINDIPLIIEDFSCLSPSKYAIVKIMFIDDPAVLDRVYNALPKEIFEKYTVLRSTPIFLEFLDKTVNKGYGVEMLSQNLNIRKEEVICVGDGGNDIDMIEYAGLGVAMGNAFPEVKEAADYITATNEEDGVAEVIRHFILKS